MIAVAHVHVFDKPQDTPGAPEMADEIQDRMVIDAFLHDNVD